MTHVASAQHRPGSTADRRLRQLSSVLSIAVVLLMLGLVTLWWYNEALLLEWKRSLSPSVYFAVLAVGGALGLPTTPFYLAGGALFGWAVALLGAAVAVLVMQALAFFIARGPLRRWSSQLADTVDTRLSSGPLRSAAARVLIVRLLPVLPTAVKSYASASVGAGFGVYLYVSWSVGFGYAAAMVMFGDSAVTGNMNEAMIALAMVAVSGLLAWRVRRRIDWYAGRRGAEHGEPVRRPEVGRK